jgi:hypothetical protein
VVWENKPFDELPQPDPQPGPDGPVDRRPDGTIASSEAAREMGRRGGQKRQLYSRILRSLGLSELPEGHQFRPYEMAGQDFSNANIASLSRMFDGTCGEGPASIIKTAGMQYAISRYMYDIGKQTGDAKLLGQASNMGNDSRVSIGAAYELQAREAAARQRSSGKDGLRPGEVWVAGKEDEE